MGCSGGVKMLIGKRLTRITFGGIIHVLGRIGYCLRIDKAISGRARAGLILRPANNAEYAQEPSILPEKAWCNH